MRVIVSASNPDPESPICPVFGRCPGFLRVEESNGKIEKAEFKENPGATMARGAGVVAAQAAVDSGASAVVTGNVGPNAFRVLQSAGLKVYRFSGSVREAVEKLAKNELETLSTPGRAGFGFGRGGAGRGGGMGRGRGGGGPRR